MRQTVGYSLFHSWLALRALHNTVQLLKCSAILHIKTSDEIHILSLFWTFYCFTYRCVPENLLLNKAYWALFFVFFEKFFHRWSTEFSVFLQRDWFEDVKELQGILVNQLCGNFAVRFKIMWHYTFWFKRKFCMLCVCAIHNVGL